MCPDVAGQNLRSRKFFVAPAAFVAVLVIELDVSVPDPVGGKLLRAVLALKYFFFFRRMFLEPVFLKAVLPLKRLVFVLAVIV